MTQLKTEEILREEAAEVHSREAAKKADLSAKTDRALNIALNGLNSAALCLSGGGIRSGAFSLGVIQALAAYPKPQPDQPTNPDG